MVIYTGYVTNVYMDGESVTVDLRKKAYNSVHPHHVYKTAQVGSVVRLLKDLDSQCVDLGYLQIPSHILELFEHICYVQVVEIEFMEDVVRYRCIKREDLDA